MIAKCESCRHQYIGADLVIRCRFNGLPTSQANADDCKRYEAGEVSKFANLCGCPVANDED